MSKLMFHSLSYLSLLFQCKFVHMVALLQVIGPNRAGYHDGPIPGVWTGRGAERLGLSGPVRIDELVSLLRGQDPHGAARLSPYRARRRAGFEMVIAAPKSVSLLATLGPTAKGAAVAEAHEKAARATLDWLEAHAALTRRGGHRSAPQPTGELAAAVFAHRTNSSGEPHLHMHGVIANLTHATAGWSALYSRMLYSHMPAAAGVYSMALRHFVADAGVNCDWVRGPDGRWEIAGVPRRAILAASTPWSRVNAGRSAYDGPQTRGVGEVARRQARRQSPAAPWPQRVAKAGLDSDRAAELLAGGLRGPPTQSKETNAELKAVDAELLRRGSCFYRRDVVVALAAVTRRAMTPAEVDSTVQRFCDTARKIGGGRLVSAQSHDVDLAVGQAATARQGSGAGVARATAEVIRGATSDPTTLRAATRLVTSGHGVEVLGAGADRETSFVTQAAVIDAARRAWQASGHETAVLAEPSAGARWRALTGLEAPAERHPTVLVVDRADRMATPDLGRILAAAQDELAKVILVSGGTSPPRRVPRSAVIESLPAVEPGGRPPTLERAAADWAKRTDRGRPALMVAAGPAEVIALNAAARRHLIAAGSLRGPEVTAAGLGLREGDQLVALRKSLARSGEFGRVVAVDPATRQAQVRWADGPLETLGTQPFPAVGHGYAVTPGLVRPGDAELVAVGEHLRLGKQSSRVVATWRAPDLWLPPELSPTIGRQRERDSGLALA